MEFIVYEGKMPDQARLAAVAAEACRPYGPIGAEVTVCRTEEELTKALHRQVAAGLERHIPFRTEEGVCFLKISDVRYFKGADHRLVAVLRDGTQLRSRTRRVSAQAMVGALAEDGRFLQATRAVFVNIDCIRSVTVDGVHLDGDETIPISRKYYGLWMETSRRREAERGLSLL